jgi:hypothetical protein
VVGLTSADRQGQNTANDVIDMIAQQQCPKTWAIHPDNVNIKR